MKDAFADPHTHHRRMLLTDAAGNRNIGVPIKYRHEPADPDLAIPAYGEHSREIGESLGVDAATLDDLLQRGVI